MELRELFTLAVDGLMLKQHNQVSEALELGINTPADLNEKIERTAEKLDILQSLLDRMGGPKNE